MPNKYLNTIIKIFDRALDAKDHKVSLHEICMIMLEENPQVAERPGPEIHRLLCQDQGDMYGIDLQIADLP